MLYLSKRDNAIDLPRRFLNDRNRADSRSSMRALPVLAETFHNNRQLSHYKPLCLAAGKSYLALQINLHLEIFLAEPAKRSIRTIYAVSLAGYKIHPADALQIIKLQRI